MDQAKPTKSDKLDKTAKPVKTTKAAKPKRTVSTRQAIPGQVLKKLRQYIIDHDLKPGDRLPTERQLAEHLKVSRNSVREALTSLESVGAVLRRPKIGCVLQPIDMAMLAEVTQFQMLRDTKDLTELFIARRLLEESILPLAVANATDEDMATLEANNNAMAIALEQNQMVYDLDEAFHRALFTAAHNKFLFQFGSLIQVFFRESRRKIRASADQPNNTVEEHRAIVAAIGKRDAKAAQKHMRHHLSNYVRAGMIDIDNTSA